MRTKWNFCAGRQQVFVLESRSRLMMSSAEGPQEKISLWRRSKRRINDFLNKSHKVHPKIGVQWAA